MAEHDGVIGGHGARAECGVRDLTRRIKTTELRGSLAFQNIK